MAGMCWLLSFGVFVLALPTSHADGGSTLFNELQAFAAACGASSCSAPSCGTAASLLGSQPDATVCSCMAEMAQCANPAVCPAALTCNFMTAVGSIYKPTINCTQTTISRCPTYSVNYNTVLYNVIAGALTLCATNKQPCNACPQFDATSISSATDAQACQCFQGARSCAITMGCQSAEVDQFCAYFLALGTYVRPNMVCSCNGMVHLAVTMAVLAAPLAAVMWIMG